MEQSERKRHRKGRNRRKRKITVVALCVAFAMLTALAAEVKNAVVDQGEEQRKESEGDLKQGEQFYTFVDVLGNSYEAVLRKDVPKTTVEKSRMIEKNGYKYYTDEEGNIISSIGVDVSKYQNEIDWEQVKASGIDFAIVRVGYRGYGEEGTLVEDELFRTHIEGALNAGLGVGVYFFSQAVNEEETLEEAQFVLDRIKDYDITYPVVFDTEEIKDAEARTDHLDKKQFTENCVTFCEAVKEAGYHPMIYANMKWMAFTLDLRKLTSYDKWYADYEPFPQCPYEFAMWQYTEKGQVPGFGSNVDLNVYFENKGENR